MTTKNLSTPGPTIPSKRITSLDVLRGLAVMGILIVNIQSFSMPAITRINPTLIGNFTGIDYVVAMLSRVLVRGKFLAIFSMLFGAGIFLMTQRIEEKGGKPALRHYLRMIWLFVIGGLHASLLWGGDILVEYAIGGLFVFLFRKLSARKLMIYAVVLLFIPIFQHTMHQVSLSNRSPELVAARARLFRSPQVMIDRDVKSQQKGWLEQTSERTKNFWFSLKMYVLKPLFASAVMLRYCALMLIGIALFKWNMLNARAPAKTYRKFLFIGLGVGLTLSATKWISSSLYSWDINYSRLFSQANGWQVMRDSFANEVGLLFLCAGYIGGAMLICRAGKLRRLTDRLAALGRMALTNYLMHSVICTFIFSGYGFGLFGKVERSVQFLIVLAILIFQLWLSPLWLKHYRYGPVEWLWRSLSYWKRQPMSKK